MEIPVIDFSELESEKRGETMALLHEACEKWGFFMVMDDLNLSVHINSNTNVFVCYLQIENHDIDKGLMEKVKLLMNTHYEHNMKHNFHSSDTAKILGRNQFIKDQDWESSFFVCHRPHSNINSFTTLSADFR